MLNLHVGQTLYSAVDSTVVIVVRAPNVPILVACAGIEMSTTRSTQTTTKPDLAAGSTQIGKRYTTDEIDVELLCTKSGGGSLTIDGVPAIPKAAKLLPASD